MVCLSTLSPSLNKVKFESGPFLESNVNNGMMPNLAGIICQSQENVKWGFPKPVQIKASTSTDYLNLQTMTLVQISLIFLLSVILMKVFAYYNPQTVDPTWKWSVCERNKSDTIMPFITPDNIWVLTGNTDNQMSIFFSVFVCFLHLSPAQTASILGKFL